MRFLIILIFFVNISFANTVSNKVDNIAKNLRCLVCDGQSIYESNSDFASDIKKLIKKKISQNASEKEIYDFLKLKYGEIILLNPEKNLKNISLWILPIAFFLFGGTLIYRRHKSEK